MVDSSGYLFVVIVTLVHNFGILSMAELEIWVNKIDKDINFITITKHIFHIREALRISEDIGVYVRTFHVIADDLSAEDPDAEPVVITEGMKRRQAMLREMGLLGPKVAKGSTDSLSVHINGSKEFELSPSTMEPFLGEIGVRVVPFLMDGNQLYEVKGSGFWREQLDVIVQKLVTLGSKYEDKLGEKRNFWSFILTIVSVVQFPICALTGYYGMNTLGLVELADDWNSDFPGVAFFWFVNGVIYAAMLGYLLHSKVILAAS